MSHHSSHTSTSGRGALVGLQGSCVGNSQEQSPTVLGIQKLLNNHFRSSHVSLRQLERINSSLHRVYLLHLTDGSRLALKCAPVASTRLLRSEHASLATEAHILGLVAETGHDLHLSTPGLLCADGTSNAGHLGCSYVLRTHIYGTPLAQLRPHLDTTSLSRIDHVLGCQLRSLASRTARQFGPALKVAAGHGTQSWREAFLLLLECVLRDAEDMLVALPYDFIRSLVQAQQAVLDEVQIPVLVAMDAGKPSSVLIDERKRTVVGLVGWGNTVWGDGLLAGVCWGYTADLPAERTRSFWGAYGRCRESEAERVRLKIYAVYSAVTAVVTLHYRPAQTDHEELEARRALTHALNDLRETVREQ